MIIKNLFVYGPDCEFHPGELRVDGDRISRSAGGDAVDGGGCYAVPGLTDIHFHGCLGHDFCDGDPESTLAIADYEAANGVTQICATTMTVGEDAISAACRAAADAAQAESSGAHTTGAHIAGIHLEGPFVSSAKRGAQNQEYIKRADEAMFRRWVQAGRGLVKQIDLAPEEPGAMEFIAAVRDRVIVSLAHTAADYDTAMAAFRAGASHVTHLYNAMPPFLHRAPGVVGAASDTPDCRCELICDGFHVAPSVIRATFRMLGRERIIMISDSILTTGRTQGDFVFGGQRVTLREGRPYMPDGSIAGSCSNLMDCLRSAVGMGIPLETAVYCAAVNPAREIGIFDDYGSLEPGKKANIALLSPDLSLRGVVLNGRLLQGVKEYL